MSDTLKPCPFCGSKARIYGNDGGNGEWIARCTKLMSCGSRGSAWLTEDEAGAAWNTRAPVVAQSATTPTPAQIGAAARVLNARNAIEAGVNVDDCWKLYGEDFKADAQAALEAAFKIGAKP